IKSAHRKLRQAGTWTRISLTRSNKGGEKQCFQSKCDRSAGKNPVPQTRFMNTGACDQPDHKHEHSPGPRPGIYWPVLKQMVRNQHGIAAHIGVEDLLQHRVAHNIYKSGNPRETNRKPCFLHGIERFNTALRHPPCLIRVDATSQDGRTSTQTGETESIRMRNVLIESPSTLIPGPNAQGGELWQQPAN